MKEEKKTNVEHILLVEDDPDIRELAELALSASGKTITAVPSGLDALDSLKTIAPDVILLDVMMKGMDGIKTFKEIRKDHLEPMIIFLTARVQSEEIDTYLALGASGVISKPFDVTKLAGYVDEIWKKEKHLDTHGIKILTIR